MSVSVLAASTVLVSRMLPRYLNCVPLLSVLALSITTTTQGYILYPGLHLVSPSYPWLGSFPPSRTVINFSTEDCSDGDGLRPAPGTGCWQYFVCSAGRVRYDVVRRCRDYPAMCSQLKQ